METEKFRDPELTKKVLDKIIQLSPPYKVKICHICGTHEWTIMHYGLRGLLPKNIEVIAGPGCPVCVVPSAEIDEAINLALDGVTVVTFGDMIRVPGSESSLLEAKASGGDVRIVYSLSDAVKMALAEPNREFVFFAIGFETTAPSTAIEVLSRKTDNLSFLVAHRLIPPAMELLLGLGDLHIDGFIAPGHVSSVIGAKAYRVFPEAYHMPTVIAGFEPLDVLFAILMLIKQFSKGEAKLENEYRRSVSWEGNVKAQMLLKRVFYRISGYWRGLGRLPESAYALKDEFREVDAESKYGVKPSKSRDLPLGCSCHLVMIGKINPDKCPLFMKACTPQKPMGPCMVSLEGTCSIWAKHKHY